MGDLGRFWGFGDGHTSQEENPERAYGKWQGPEKQKSYQITLKTTDGMATVVAKKTIIVKRQDCIARNKHFCKYANGIVRDTNTGLEWFAGTDRYRTWDETNTWVENLSVGGRSWRMPTRKELKTLYQKGAGSRNITPLLETTGWWVWPCETKGSSVAWTFLLYYGDERSFSRSYSYDNFGRGFAVRSRR